MLVKGISLNTVFYRVDDRLVHGQIVEGWVKFLNATKIVVIDDKVADDPIYRSAMEIAVPLDIKIRILPVENSISEIDRCCKDKEITIALFSNLEDVYKAVRLGLRIEKLNLGGLRFVKEKKSISKTVFLNKEEADILEKLINLGIEISIQSIPSEPSKDIQKT